MKNKFEIIQPDDWHVHFREDEMLKIVTQYSARINRRCIAMPNTNIPITKSIDAESYKFKIKNHAKVNNFEIDNKIFKLSRKIIIVSFILFEVIAQYTLLKKIYSLN